MHHFTRITRITALLSSLAISSLAQADVLNGHFNAGLSGWQTFGDAAVLAPSNPWQLTQPFTSQALVLSTATLGADDYPLADGHFNVSGQDAGLAGMPGGLEEFVGVAPGSLDPDPIDHTTFLWEGSAARQIFTVQAGDTLRFDWNLLSADRDFADQAFVVVDANDGLGPQVLTLGDATQATLGVAGNADLLQTGLHQFSHTFTQAGQVTFAVAVADLQDGAKTTLLSIDNVQVTASVPEPASAVLVMLALGAWGFGMQRRTHQRQA
jgi:hypothetical protein